MKLKQSTTWRDMHSSMWYARLLADIVSLELFDGREATITSGRDGVHMRESLHYSGKAMDLRIRDLSPGDIQKFASTLAMRLGPDFDVVIETTHIHIEYDPKVGAGNG